MIRLKPFDRISYQGLRETYLKQLLDFDVIAPELCDILSADRCVNINSISGKPIPQSLKNYLYLQKNMMSVKERLRLLLIGPEPEDMPKSFGGNGKYKTMRQVLEEIIDGFKPLESDAKEIYKEIFDYRKFSGSNQSISERTAYWLQKQLDVKVCPFCNRIYTTTLFNRSVRPAFDHFYPKSTYPYLAVSLFNLIPICDICNKAKSNKIDPIIYPYDESFDECFEANLPLHAAFRVLPNGDQPWYVLYGQSEEFTLQFHPTDSADETLEERRGGVLVLADLDNRFPAENHKYWERVINSIKILKLEDLYDTHKNEIMRILRNRYIYNHTAIISILKPFLQTKNHNTSDAALTLEAQNMLYFANLDPEDWGITPLNKLKADILKQMDIIEMASSDMVEPLREDEENGERRYFSAAGAVAGV